MNNTNLETVHAIMQHQRVRLRLLVIVTLVFVVIASIGMSYIPFAGFPDGWSFDVVRYQLQNGTFWLFPGSAFYQHTMILGVQNILELLMAFLLEFTLVWLAVHGLYRTFVLLMVGSQRRSNSMNLEEALRFGSDAQHEVMLDENVTAVFHVVGDACFLEVNLSPAVPNFFVDSKSYKIEQCLGRRPVLPTHQRIVLDGVSDQAMDIYTELELSQAAKYFTSDITQHFVKQLPGCDVFVSNGRMHVTFHVKDIRSVNDMHLLADSVVLCRAMLIKRATRLYAHTGQTPSVYNVMLGTRVHTLPFLATFPMSILRGFVAYLLVMMLIPILFLGMEVSVGALLGPVWVAVMYTVLVYWMRLRSNLTVRGS